MKAMPILCTCLLAGLLCASCTTPEVSSAAGRTILVTLLNKDTVQVDGKSIRVGLLAGALKAKGADPKTGIRIDVPADTPMTTLSDLTRRLTAAGYTRVLFTKPRKADAEIDPADTPRAPRR